MNSNKKTPIIIALLFLIAIVVTVFIIYSSEKYAIIVNDEKLTVEAFNSAMENEIRFAQIREEELDEEKIKQELIEKMIDKMIFSSYLSSLGIDILEEDLDKIYEGMIEDNPDVNTKEELHRQWREQERDINIIEKQLKEDLAHEKLFEEYFEKIEVTDEELEKAYEEHLDGVEEFGWYEIEKEDLYFYLKHNKTHHLLEEEREKFEENANIEVLI